LIKLNRNQVCEYHSITFSRIYIRIVKQVDIEAKHYDYSV